MFQSKWICSLVNNAISEFVRPSFLPQKDQTAQYMPLFPSQMGSNWAPPRSNKKTLCVHKTLRFWNHFCFSFFFGGWTQDPRLHKKVSGNLDSRPLQNKEVFGKSRKCCSTFSRFILLCMLPNIPTEVQDQKNKTPTRNKQQITPL